MHVIPGGLTSVLQPFDNCQKILFKRPYLQILDEVDGIWLGNVKQSGNIKKLDLPLVYELVKVNWASVQRNEGVVAFTM